MKQSCLTVLALALALVSGAPEAVAFKIIGAGTDLCGTWTIDRHSPGEKAALQDQQWVLGFLSGIGYVSAADIDPLKGVDAKTVLAWIDDYCRDHPNEDIELAAAAFYHAHPR